MKTTPYLSKTGKATLVVLEERKIRNYDLGKRHKWTFGRECPENYPDIAVYSPIVGRKHGEFLCINEEWFYIDQGSRNGTWHNGKKISLGLNGKVRPVMLNDGDILRVDADNLDTPDGRGIWIFFTTTNIAGTWENYSFLGKDKITVGRDEDCCDIVINRPYISAKHMLVTFEDGNYAVSDCGSLAGTYLNGVCVEQKKYLREKDRISICDCHFIFTGMGMLYVRPTEIDIEPDITSDQKTDTAGTGVTLIKADIQTKKVPNNNGNGKKELIRDIHLEVQEGTLVALLGSSGAGKTTVMNCLNGMDLNGVEGTVYLRGEDLYKNFNRLKFLIGSVPQKEVFHPMLTVEEELREAAIMRLPGDMKSGEIKRHVDATIKNLGLENIRKSKIQKCSGGEQRRVNIAIELVADRKILCLDEPDAGLDPGTKQELFTILRDLAHREGKTILVIIHDVSDIALFDQVIMMAKVDNVGRLAFSGTPEQGKAYFGKELKEAYQLLSEHPEQYVQ